MAKVKHMARRLNIIQRVQQGIHDWQVNRTIDKINKIGSRAMDRVKKEELIRLTRDAVPITDVFQPTKSQLATPKYVGNSRRFLGFNGMILNAWNMLDMFHAYTAEVYLKFAIDSYVEGAFRNGYQIYSENPIVMDYLNKRHKEFEVVTGIQTDELFRAQMHSLVLYGNVFLSKYRSERNSSGSRYTRFDGKEMNPIAGLYVEDTRRIMISRDEPVGKYIYLRQPLFMPGLRHLNPKNTNNIAFEASMPKTAWSIFTAMFRGFSSMQAWDDKVVEVKQEDMVHIRYHASPGEKWAMPPFYPALTDIETLRQLEEHIDLLMFQYGHPLFHVTVGDDHRRGTQEEINDQKQKLHNMESNGFVVTDNRVKMEFLGAEGKAVAAEGYLNYFKNRVFAGLWLSQTTVGESGGANRATADIIDKIKADKTIELQSIIATAYQTVLIELLQEAKAPLEWILRPENIPTIKFNEVDVATKNLIENGIIQKFTAGIISRTEARAQMGMKPMTPEQEKDTALAFSAEADKQLAAAKATASNKAAPANQYGKKTTRKRSINSSLSTSEDMGSLDDILE